MQRYLVPKQGNPDACQQLFQHPFQKQVLFDGTCFLFQSPLDQKWHKWPGITGCIEKKFFFDYRAPTGHELASHKTSSTKDEGDRIHRQIHHVYTCIPREECQCTKRVHLSRLSSRTKSAIKFIKDFDVEPNATEYTIISPASHTGTRLDMIGKRFSGQSNQLSVIVSWKTGYAIDYDKNPLHQKMHGGLEEYESTPQHHNQLQSIIEYQMLKQDYGIQFDEYIIVYLDKDVKYRVEYLKDSALFRDKDGIFQYYCT